MIGKGPVEKEQDVSENKPIPLLCVFCLIIISFVIAFYLIGQSLFFQNVVQE